MTSLFMGWFTARKACIPGTAATKNKEIIKTRIAQPHNVGTRTFLLLINRSLTKGRLARKFGFFANIPYPKLIDKVKISAGRFPRLGGAASLRDLKKGP